MIPDATSAMHARDIKNALNTTHDHVFQFPQQMFLKCVVHTSAHMRVSMYVKHLLDNNIDRNVKQITTVFVNSSSTYANVFRCSCFILI